MKKSRSVNQQEKACSAIERKLYDEGYKIVVALRPNKSFRLSLTIWVGGKGCYIVQRFEGIHGDCEGVEVYAPVCKENDLKKTLEAIV